MSQVPLTATYSPNFDTIYTAALDAYKKKTKKDIASHPLAAQLQSCDSPNAILAVLRAQVQANDEAQSADEKWTKWLDPTVNVVSAFSAVLNAAGPVITSRHVVQGVPSDLRDHRYSHLRLRFLPELAFFSRCACSLTKHRRGPNPYIL